MISAARLRERIVFSSAVCNYLQLNRSDNKNCSFVAWKISQKTVKRFQSQNCLFVLFLPRVLLILRGKFASQLESNRWKSRYLGQQLIRNAWRCFWHRFFVDLAASRVFASPRHILFISPNVAMCKLNCITLHGCM